MYVFVMVCVCSHTNIYINTYTHLYTYVIIYINMAPIISSHNQQKDSNSCGFLNKINYFLSSFSLSLFTTFTLCPHIFDFSNKQLYIINIIYACLCVCNYICHSHKIIVIVGKIISILLIAVNILKEIDIKKIKHMLTGFN